MTESPSVPFSKDRETVENLRTALEETLDCLKRFAGGAEGDHNPLTGLPYNEGSLVFIQTSLRHSPMPLKVDNTVRCLWSMQSDIKTNRDKVDYAFLRTMELYNLISNQQPYTSTKSSAMMTLRDKLIHLLKPRKSRRTGAGDENWNLQGKSTSAIALQIREARGSSFPDVPTSSLLLQLPTELLIIIIDVLHNDPLEDIPSRTEPLLTLRL